MSYALAFLPRFCLCALVLAAVGCSKAPATNEDAGPAPSMQDAGEALEPDSGHEPACGPDLVDFDGGCAMIDPFCKNQPVGVAFCHGDAKLTCDESHVTFEEEPCGTHEQCETVDGAPECVCAQHYERDSDGQCVCTSLAPMCTDGKLVTCDEGAAKVAQCKLGCFGQDACLEVKQLALGTSTSCALLADQSVRCWGEAIAGRLGDGSTESRARPGVVPDLLATTLSSAGHTCAVTTDASVKCWGDNFFGQVGADAPNDTPKEVAGVEGAVAVSAGLDHTCALLDDATVMCWGRNDAGQLGSGTIDNSSGPSAVTGLSDVVEIAAGDSHTCARLETGSVWCWGANARGELTDGTLTPKATPVQVAGLAKVEQIAARKSYTCALLADATVTCWGMILGGGTWPLTPVEGVSDAQELGLGRVHACVRHDDGSISCWGNDNHGQLGNGTKAGTAVIDAAKVEGISGVIELAVGSDHTCVLRKGGDISCWGRNLDLQLGNDSGAPCEPEDPCNPLPSAVRW